MRAVVAGILEVGHAGGTFHAWPSRRQRGRRPISMENMSRAEAPIFLFHYFPVFAKFMAWCFDLIWQVYVYIYTYTYLKISNNKMIPEILKKQQLLDYVILFVYIYNMYVHIYIYICIV